MRALHCILLCICTLSSVLVTSCDVHEFPDPATKEVQFVLHLNYDTNLPLYKIVEYHEHTRNRIAEDFDIRYIVKAFDATGSRADEREELYHFEFTKDEVDQLNHSVKLTLLPGAYKFIVWTDYIHTGTNQDLYYNTENYDEIILQSDPHEGSNDLRDAFNGYVTSEVSKDVSEATVEMGRPLAKFNFISDDVTEFISRVMALRAAKSFNESKTSKIELTSYGEFMPNTSESVQSIDFNDFVVVFRYHGFMPCSFNMFTNKPADARTGVSFNSELRRINDNEAELGFDYVFVNGNESSVTVSVEVYDYDGEIISSFKPVDVPIVRSKLTTIRANFLTSKTEGGVAIAPEFDGEYNYVVD